MLIVFVLIVCANIYSSFAKPQVNLEYQPIQSSFVGTIGTNFVGQIVPPGKPWPASAEGYQNFSVLQSSTSRPNLSDRFPEIPTETSVQRPSFVGPSGTQNLVGQLVPPGKPWPASVSGYQNFSVLPQKPQLADRFPEIVTENVQRPSFVGSVGTNFVGQIIPPGKPWPANAEEYQNFRDQTSTTNPTRLPDSDTETFPSLLHTTEGITIFTSIPNAPVEHKLHSKVTALKPPKDDNVAPIRSEITQIKNTYNGDLNNLDFFKPQFQKQPETFLAPVGIHQETSTKLSMILQPPVTPKTTSKPQLTTTTVPPPQISVSNLLPSEAEAILSNRNVPSKVTNLLPPDSLLNQYNYRQTNGNVQKRKTYQIYSPYGNIQAEIFIADDQPFNNYQPINSWSYSQQFYKK